MKMMGEGAEAKVYSGNFLGVEVVIKDRVRKRYRIKEIDDSLRKRRTKTEARMLYAASSNGINAPNVLLVDGTKLYIRRIKARNLHEYTNGGMVMAGAKMGHALYSAGVQCGILHNIGIAHGDFTPANMMIDGDGGLWIIDFGLAEATRSAEDKALDLLLMKRAVSKGLFARFLSGYRKSSVAHAEITRRLAEIERRGRYQTRTLG